jgi:hypothetical protein
MFKELCGNNYVIKLYINYKNLHFLFKIKNLPLSTHTKNNYMNSNNNISNLTSKKKLSGNACINYSLELNKGQVYLVSLELFPNKFLTLEKF